MTTRWLRVVCIVALVAGGAAPALGSSTGRTGLTTDASGCNQCHSGGSAPTVTLTGPTSVTPGSTSEYLLEIVEVGLREKGGLDAGASAGTLAVGGAHASGTKLFSGEITHTTPKDSDGTSVKFSFLWTAPAGGGTSTLRAWGNAVNGNGLPTGDRAAFASLDVDTGPTASPTPTSTPTPDPCPSAHCLDCSDLCDCADAKPSVCIGYCASGACVNVGGACACQELPTPTPTVTPTITPTPNVDHFTCYKAGPTKGSAKFAGPSVILVDQFGASTVAVKKPQFLCAPTNKLGEDPTAPFHAEHLKGYQIKPASKRVLPTRLAVTDQFHPNGLTIDATKESHLLVPTVKSLSATPALPASFVVGHFQCYKAKVSKGTPKFVPVADISLEDQFGTMRVDVKKPRYLCNPVNKNGEGITDPVSHLMCYQIKQAKGDPKFGKRSGVFVNDQFGAARLDVKIPAELCVPATKTP